ncbi:hypothetical protein E0W68_13785 [Flavobacterium salilacus subsp. salilacus]|nr:hypothetical protein E0W68_13785 [Flavobacterium salilacus subsp. salilacus]MBE1615189.1 hypothetical protein [Flavobacterium sp. SaA2.13]
MNRLTEAQYINVGNYTLVDYPTEIEDYTTQNILYDKNGNLIRLHRTGLTAANTIDRIDMLNYTYLPNSNRLKAVADEADIVKGFRDDTNNNTMDYDYDLNGNMTKDLNKGIGTQSTKGITYNHLNLPVQVTFSGSQTGTVNYIYDATGAKMQKKVVDNGNVTVTDYANRFIYENGVLKSFSHPEGYVRVPEPDNDEYHPDKFDYIYQYKDHLGNVRLSYADANGNGLIDDAQQFNDGFESQSGWTSDTDSQYTAWNLSDYDSYNTHTGNYSGRIDNPGSTEKFVHSSYWMPINNSVATQYTFSAWVYSDGPTADLYLFMKEQGEDDYYTLVAYAVTPAGVRGQWVKIQATVSVPAHIKKLNLRIDNNGGGTVWFDDVELKKTSGTTGITSEIIEENNYYAFGMKHEGYNNVAVSSDPALKYKYNGMELQDEMGLDWYDYQARNYDPSLGRWFNVDPLAETSRRYSPYTYCLDNPIYFIDPDGMEAEDSAVDMESEMEEGIGDPPPKSKGPAGAYTPSAKTKSYFDKASDFFSEVVEASAGLSIGLQGGVEGTVGPVKVGAEASLISADLETNSDNLVKAEITGPSVGASASIGDAKIGATSPSGSRVVEVSHDLDVKSHEVSKKGSVVGTLGKKNLELKSSGTVAVKVKAPLFKAKVSVNLYNAAKGVENFVKGAASYLGDVINNLSDD